MSFRGKALARPRVGQTGPDVRTAAVLIPKPGTAAGQMIDSGSGIVADLQQVRIAGRIEVFFEGGRYGADNVQTFEDRVTQAAGRLARQYPTVARGYFDPRDFVTVGAVTWTADWRQHAVQITSPATVAAWIGAPA